MDIIDQPKTTELRKHLIKKKGFLKKIYLEWYNLIIKNLPKSQNKIIELGSGAGFFKDLLPNLITTDIIKLPWVDLKLDARHLNFKKNYLDGIVMTNVFHHIPEASLFLEDAQSYLKVNGKIIMIEPWPTLWSKFFYKNFHHEPFNLNAEWKFDDVGPLSGANGALPWIIFKRDKKKFESKYSNLKIKKIEPFMPFSYIFSGGMTKFSLMPSFSYSLIRFLENLLPNNYFSMFAYIEIVKVKSKK